MLTSAGGKYAFPNFLVIGAQKSGTTALYSLLKQHPQIFMCPSKEPHFFAFEGRRPQLTGINNRIDPMNANAVIDVETYVQLFSGAGDALAAGECSISTLYVEGTAERIQAFNPAMKLVACLRHPVERAYSSFNHARRKGFETLGSLTAGFAAERQRIEANVSFVLRYRDLGLYARQLKPFLDRFPSEQLKVILYDDYVRDPAAVMKDLYRFLGVDDQFEPDTTVRENIGVVPQAGNPLHSWLNSDTGLAKTVIRKVLPRDLRRKVGSAIKLRLYKRPEKLQPEERNRLIEHFREDISELQDLIERPLDHWLQPLEDS